jgi:hypothetical protein
MTELAMLLPSNACHCDEGLGLLIAPEYVEDLILMTALGPGSRFDDRLKNLKKLLEICSTKEQPVLNKKLLELPWGYYSRVPGMLFSEKKPEDLLISTKGAAYAMFDSRGRRRPYESTARQIRTMVKSYVVVAAPDIVVQALDTTNTLDYSDSEPFEKKRVCIPIKALDQLNDSWKNPDPRHLFMRYLHG